MPDYTFTGVYNIPFDHYDKPERTKTCSHGVPTYIVCTECLQERDAKKHRVQALADALAKADGDLKQAFLESHGRAYDLAHEVERLKMELKQAVSREEQALRNEQKLRDNYLYEVQASLSPWKQRAYNAESTISFQAHKIQELEQERANLRALVEFEKARTLETEKTIPAQTMRKLDLE